MGVFEFCELFVQRYDKMESEYGLDIEKELSVSPGIIDPYEQDGYLEAFVTAGLVSIVQTDYTIHDILMDFQQNDADLQTNQLCSAKCVAAISALERNDATDFNKVRFLQRDPIVQAIDI